MEPSARRPPPTLAQRFLLGTIALSLTALLTWNLCFGIWLNAPNWIRWGLIPWLVLMLYSGVSQFYRILFNRSDVTAIPDYSRGDWEKLKRLAADPHKLGESYEAWRASQDNLRSGLNAREMPYETVRVDVSSLEQWCRERNCRNTVGARSRYAQALLRMPERDR